jgi:glyoxylase-like metal-dependent hydrolase (beta-lactamase superfamily II)
MPDATPTIRAFFDQATNTVSYLVADMTTGQAAVIDPVLDYCAATGEVDTGATEAILGAAAEAGLTIEWVLETHIHADHLSGACIIAGRTGARVGIGAQVREVQRIFRPVFGAADLVPDGRVFDHLFEDGEELGLGGLRQLPDWRCCVCRGHAVHAGHGHRARGFSGRRCRDLVPLHHPAARLAAGNTHFRVPRLFAGRP